MSRPTAVGASLFAGSRFIVPLERVLYAHWRDLSADGHSVYDDGYGPVDGKRRLDVRIDAQSDSYATRAEPLLISLHEPEATAFVQALATYHEVKP